MKIISLSRKKLFLVILFGLISNISIVHAQIICDKFNLETEFSSTILKLSVDTDLPDYTVVMVSVSRSYKEKGNAATYSVDYFSEKSTVGKWRSVHQIAIARDDWDQALRTKQEEMSSYGLGFEVASISDNIDVRMVVPIRQKDPRFGDRNSKLRGKAVRAGGSPIVEDEVEKLFPLNSRAKTKSHVTSFDPLNLDVGQKYILSRQTPLMPSYSPVDITAAMKKMKEIPVGGSIKIQKAVSNNGKPWYKVIAYDQRKKRIGMGWINSTALLGQKLKSAR